MTNIHALCKRGCKRTPANKSQLCDHCEDRIHQWLIRIPDNYALLATFLEPGSTESNPDSKATKNPTPPIPVRLEILDLLDDRLGRKWQGTAAAKDRRGVVGELQGSCETLIERRPLTTEPAPATVVAACRLLDRHRVWIYDQEWVTDLYDDLERIDRDIKNGIGEYRRPPVGRCHVVPEDAEDPCGGGLFANRHGGVRCSRCGAIWDAAHLRQLGLAQAAAQQEAS